MVQSSGLSVDPTAQEPLYRQLFDQVVGRIRQGVYPPGFRLPPTRLLADEIGTHRNTVVRAYQDLEQTGFVTSTVGRGTFVALRLPESRPAPAEVKVAGIPWTALVSRSASNEPLGRADRLARFSSVGPDVIDLTRMQPSTDLLPEDLLRRCLDHVLRNQGPRALGYCPRDGLPRLRALIAEDLGRQGVPAAPEDIIVTTGSQQALDLIARTLVNPGDVFLVEEFTYSGVVNLLATAGARIVPVPSDAEGPDLAALERMNTLGAKGLYLMPNCNNPTGRRLPQTKREALIAWSRRAGVPLIEDDYAADLALGEGPLPSPMRALDGDVIYVGTFSKRLIPALRIGFLVCPRTLRPLIGSLRHAMDLGTSVLLQHALAEFLSRGYLRGHLAKVVPEYRRRRDTLAAALTRDLPRSLRFRLPEAGVALWLPLPEGVPAEAVYEEGRRHGVLVTPGTLNGVDERTHGGVRIAFASVTPERIVEGSKRLGRALRALVDRPGESRESTVGFV
jgi:GntR family transcriptional regulator / MocR family aminotransferase